MKRVLVAVAIVVAILVLAAVALPFFINANEFRPLLESKLSKVLGRQVKLGELKLSLLSGGITATDLSIADDPKFGPGAFLSAQSLTIGVGLQTLILARKLHVNRIAIDQPNIAFLQDPAGAWNFSTLGTASSGTTPKTSEESALDLSVKILSITDGKIVLARTKSKTKPEVFEKVEIQVQDFASEAAFPFSLSTTGSGGAVVKVEGKAGPLNSTNVAATPLEATLNVSHLDLARSGFLPATGFAG